MKIVRGTLQEYRDQLLPLFKEHWEEIGLAGGRSLELNVWEEYYQYLVDRNSYLAYALIDGDQVIGYLSIFIYNHPHHMHERFAITDAFLVKKSARSTATYKAIREMFLTAENTLATEFNVRHFQFVYSVHHDLSRLGQSLGFVSSDRVMVKSIK